MKKILLLTLIITNLCFAQTDRDALRAIYISANGENWTDPWDLDTTIDNWAGVTVDQNGRVISLILLNRNMVGSLSNQLGDLSELIILSITGSQLLEQEIPSTIGNLVNLETLRITGNGISGAIPSQITSLQSLNLLDLSSNDLSGNIPSSLGNISTLTSLNLGDNNLEGGIPIEFENLLNIETLDLQNTGLEGTLPANMSNFLNLNTLRLNGNNFQGTIPNFTATNLSSFSITGNNFVFDDFESEFTYYDSNLSLFDYSNQAKVDEVETLDINEEDNVTLSVNETTSANNTYRWRKDGVDIINATDRTYTINNVTVSDNGLYDCVINNTVVTGLTLTRNSISLIVSTLSIQGFENIGANVYPNPSKQYLKIALGSLTDENVNATFINMLGQKVLIKNKVKNKGIIDISKLNDGFYILKLSSKGKSFIKKILKQ